VHALREGMPVRRHHDGEPFDRAQGSSRALRQAQGECRACRDRANTGALASGCVEWVDYTDFRNRLHGLLSEVLSM